jgi:ABC-type polysaccharide/polyol phosphate transport system ATPase subunit
MKNNTVITFDKVSKKYFLLEDRTFKELLPNLILRRKITQKKAVFTNLSFTIQQGETVGIIGRNGAGKSTIMKLIAGVTNPTQGKVIIKENVAPLIELSSGFHHELTGYENIFLNAAILGMHKEEIEQQVNNIIAFSELGEFMNVPVKRYSTGMYMRLAFSIAVHTMANILLIDEVLAVGDEQFQKKCINKLKSIKEDQNRTIIFISHDEKAVRDFCERVIFIHEGRLVFDGAPAQAFTSYHQLTQPTDQP